MQQSARGAGAQQKVVEPADGGPRSHFPRSGRKRMADFRPKLKAEGLEMMAGGGRGADGRGFLVDEAL